MRIIGFNLSKISIQRKENFQGKLSIDQNIDIKDLKTEKMDISPSDTLKIGFNFTIKYSDDFAKLEFEGKVIILPDKDELKKFQDAWKNKQVPEGFRIPLFNFIMNKCNIKALTLEDEMALPYHVPMPRLNPEQNQQ